jgi:hypothetical protein
MNQAMTMTGRSRLFWLLLALPVLVVCGCHKTAMVFGPSIVPPAIDHESERKAAEKKELPGIPFFSHYGVCTQETVWLEPQTTLSLTVTPDGGKPVTQTITLNNRAFHDPAPQGHDANSLLSSLNQVEGKHDHADAKFCPANVAQGWTAVRDAYRVTPINDASAGDLAAGEQNQTLIKVSNTADIGTAVDYSRVYYLNAKSPLIGTGTVDAKLNPDGTLGEGSASVDDETLGDILTAAATVGSGGLTAWSTVAAARITGNATIQAGAAAQAAVVAVAKPSICEAKDGWPEVRDSVAYEFTVTSAGFKHDHKKVTPLEKEYPVGQCLVSDVTGGNYTITPVSGDSKPDKNAIGVSGTITLPKAKDGTATKP